LSIIAVLVDQENAKSATTMDSKEDIFPAPAVPTSDSPVVVIHNFAIYYFLYLHTFIALLQIPSVPSVRFKDRRNHAAWLMLFLDKVDYLTKTNQLTSGYVN
jgi:hypothetical protein